MYKNFRRLSYYEVDVSDVTQLLLAVFMIPMLTQTPRTSSWMYKQGGVLMSHHCDIILFLGFITIPFTKV